MKKGKSDLLQGTLDLLILKTLRNGKMHGWGISQKICLLSKEAFDVKEGSMYPALHRLERKGWIKAEWGSSEKNRRAKFYELTSAGLEQFEVEQQEWVQFTHAVTLVLDSGE